MKYISVCSGIEAASVAWEPLGWTPVAFSEIEPFPAAVLKHHWPKVPNHGDMTKYEQWNIPGGTVDLLVGGTPCQSFSVAGLRKGLDDPRGGLMLTFLKIAQRFQPRWIVWENVPGVLSSNGGRDFGSFLGALGELGYGWAYRVLDAQWFGVAQRRRRVFVVGCLGDGASAAKVLFESESVRRDSPPSREKGKGIAADAQEGVGVSGIAGSLSARDFKGFDRGDMHQLSKLVPIPEKDVVLEAINAGIPDVCATIDCGLSKQVGKQLTQQAESFYFPIPDNLSDVTTEVSPTLRAQNSVKGNQNSSWNVAVAFQESELRLTGKITEQKVVPTLKAGTKGGDTEPKVVAFEPGIAAREGNESRFVEEMSPTLRKDMGDNQVAVAVDTYNQALQDKAIPIRSDKSDICHTGGVIDQRQRMAVRRLTPKECERLQGFPDNHTIIPWRGKAADQCPDGPRYKALGNSMAVPCMAWIGKRIAKAEHERQRAA